MVAEIPGMGDAGRVYTGIYRRYGKYPVYTGIFGVLRPLYCLPAPRRATARRAGPSAARTWRRSSHAPVGLLLFTGARARRGAAQARRGRARQPRRTRLRVARGKTKIPGMGKRARAYTGIYRYFTIPVYTLRNTPATITMRDTVTAPGLSGEASGCGGGGRHRVEQGDL